MALEALGSSVGIITQYLFYPLQCMSDQMATLSTEQSMDLFHVLVTMMAILFGILTIGSILYIASDKIADGWFFIVDHVNGMRIAKQDTVDISETNEQE